MSANRFPKWLWGAAVIVLIVAVNLVMALVHFVTANPVSCLSCHGTGGTPDMSKGSLVHPTYAQVKCVDCHAKPGQYVLVEGYRGGFSADPPKLSASCVRCHSDVPSRQNALGFKFNPVKIDLSHKAHLERGANCTDCHQNLAHDPSPEPTNRPRMEYCYQCHDRSTSCTKCHGTSIPSEQSFTLPWTAPVKPVSTTPSAIPHSLDGRSTCLVCHQTGVAGATKVPVSHAGRTDEICAACHQPAAAKPAPATTTTTGVPSTTRPVPGTTATTITPSTTTAAPATTTTTASPPGGLPKVPHGLEGRNACLACHGSGLAGATKVPASHAGRGNDMCLLCHTR